jgi:hypothetical protein
MNRRFKWAALLALSCAYGSEAGLCHAQEDRVDARAAAAEGAKAFQEGRWADAIDYFTRAESLVHAPPHLLYIARSQKQTGLLVQARENLLAIIREDLPATAPRAFRQAQDDAKAELKDLEPRLPYVTVTLKGAGSASVTITQDGNKIPSALIGVPRPVDPGSHQFEATAGALKGRANVDLKEGEKKRVVLEMGTGDLPPAAAPAPAPSPGPAPGPAASPTPAPGAGPVEQPPSAPPPQADTGGGGGGKGLLIGSFIGFGVGAVGLAVGTIFTLNASSKQSDSDSMFDQYHCGDPAGPTNPVAGCPDQQSQIQDLQSSADSARTLGMIGFIAGGVGVATGVTLLVLSGSHKDQPKAASIPTLNLLVAPSSVRVGGTF